jgi:asparagine synthase (glutamine-hydrolysing)
LSGGLDSSSIVGLISKEFRSDLNHPLRTFSLIRHDRENCPDWFSIQEILKHDDWIEPSVITSNISTDAYLDFLDCIPNADEPFALADGFPSFMIFSAARANGCKFIFDGGAGDLLFYGYNRSADAIMKRKLYGWLPAFVAASSRHRFGIARGIKTLARRWLADVAPVSARAAHRRLRAKHATPEHEFPLLRPEIARELWATKHARRPEALDHSNRSNDQFDHARIFTSGAISFAYEGGGELANGIELRSPFSDRRMVEFAVRMPVEAKLFAYWYKHILRKSMHGVLPEAVRWRQDMHGHPGWKFYERVLDEMLDKAPPISHSTSALSSVGKWFDPRTACKLERSRSYEDRLLLYRVLLLSRWLKQGKLGF